MNAILLLFIVGVIFLGVEVIVPGAILGIIGGLAMLAGVLLAFYEFGVTGGWIALAIALALVGLTLIFEFVVLPRTKVGKKAFLTAAIDGTSQPMPATRDAVVGRDAEAVTPLSPTGVVTIDGKRYEAFCRSGRVESGARLRVVGLDNFRLIVASL